MDEGPHCWQGWASLAVRPSVYDTRTHTHCWPLDTETSSSSSRTRDGGGAATSKYLIQQLLLLSRVPQGAAQVEVVFALLLLRGVKQVRPKSVSNDNLFQAVSLSFYYSSSACCC